jgi:hypothetical protein
MVGRVLIHISDFGVQLLNFRDKSSGARGNVQQER